jgi:hypothetical protein
VGGKKGGSAIASPAMIEATHQMRTKTYLAVAALAMVLPARWFCARNRTAQDKACN